MRVGSSVAVVTCLAVLVAAMQAEPHRVHISGIEVEPTSVGAVFRFRDWVMSVGAEGAVISYVGVRPMEDELTPARAVLSLPTGKELPPPVLEEKLPRAVAASVQTARGMARTLLEDQRVLKAYVDEDVLAGLRALSRGRFRVRAEASSEWLEIEVADGFLGDSRFVRLEFTQAKFRVRASISPQQWQVGGEMRKLDLPPRSRFMEVARGVPERTQPALPDPRFRIARLEDGRILLTASYWSTEELGEPIQVAREYLDKMQRTVAAGLVETEGFVADELARVRAELSKLPDAVITESAGVHHE